MASGSSGGPSATGAMTPEAPTEKERQLIAQLRNAMLEIPPLDGEDDFFISVETLVRFLKARDWDLSEAEKMLKAAVEWRRKTDPLRMDCQWCHDSPGYHGIRQVGFDELGRPVIYACFNQATASKPTAEDSVAHCTYLIENAKRTMAPGVSTWVFIMDCSGMSLPACNPRLGYGVTQVFANYYPERLGLVICIHHNALFQGVWNAFKIFLHPNTVAKMHLIRSKKKVREEFDRLFSRELNDWLLAEIKLNKKRPLVQSQREFWRDPSSSSSSSSSSCPGAAVASSHDPRGCPSYVAKYIDPFLKQVARNPRYTHRPHPNIVDALRGVVKPLPSSSSSSVNGTGAASGAASGAAAADEGDSSEGEDQQLPHNALSGLEFDEEFQIPKSATGVTKAK